MPSERDRKEVDERVMMVWGRKRQRGTYDPTPSGTLNPRRLGVHLLFQPFQSTEILVNELFEFPSTDDLAFLCSSRCQVFPKQRMVDMSSTVELDRGLKGDQLSDGRWGLRLRGEGGDGGFRSVEVGYVRLVVFGMVELHDVLDDMRLEGLGGST
jgi:hypothetical protein